MAPRIALGVVSCNRPVYLAETLRGVAAYLSSVVDRVYIGDDGSDRKHQEALWAAYDECPDAIVAADPLNRGVAASKNRLLRLMLEDGADWLFLLEDDIVPQTPAAVLGYLAACDESGWQHLSYAWHGTANATGPVEVDGAVSYFTHYVGAFCVYSRECLKSCGLYDEGFCNAWDHVELTLRLARSGYTDPRPWHAADATGSENWLREIPGSIENSAIRLRPDWRENIERSEEYWQRASPETYAMLFEPSRVKASRVDEIPEDRDARLVFLQRWATSQQRRLAEDEQRPLAEDEQRRLAVEEIARTRPARERARVVGQAPERTGQGVMLDVYVPFTEFAPGVREALKATRHLVTEVYVGARDDAYWELLNRLWSKGQSFIVVEHDIVVRADTFEELENCPYEWCSFGAPYLEGVHHGLGCVKFSDTLISRHPKAMEQVAARRPDPAHPPKHYCRLDAYLQVALSVEYRHCHETVLEHVRPYDGPPQPSHGCNGWIP